MYQLRFGFVLDDLESKNHWDLVSGIGANGGRLKASLCSKLTEKNKHRFKETLFEVKSFQRKRCYKQSTVCPKMRKDCLKKIKNEDGMFCCSTTSGSVSKALKPDPKKHFKRCQSFPEGTVFDPQAKGVFLKLSFKVDVIRYFQVVFCCFLFCKWCFYGLGSKHLPFHVTGSAQPSSSLELWFGTKSSSASSTWGIKVPESWKFSRLAGFSRCFLGELPCFRRFFHGIFGVVYSTFLVEWGWHLLSCHFPYQALAWGYSGSLGGFWSSMETDYSL